MRTPLRTRVSLFVALASLTVLSACVGGLPYRRPGSDLVLRDGPSGGSWWADAIACAVLPDSSSSLGAKRATNYCAQGGKSADTGREPVHDPAHPTP